MKTQPTIAIADDHAQYRNGLQNILTCWGYQIITTAENGEQLIQSLGTAQQLPDICIIDIEMPVMNGIEATSIVKDKWPLIKVVGHSMNTSKHIEKDIIEAGADVFVPKGEVSQLKLVIDELLATTFCR